MVHKNEEGSLLAEHVQNAVRIIRADLEALSVGHDDRPALRAPDGELSSLIDKQHDPLLIALLHALCEFNANRMLMTMLHAFCEFNSSIHKFDNERRMVQLLTDGFSKAVPVIDRQRVPGAVHQGQAQDPPLLHRALR